MTKYRFSIAAGLVLMSLVSVQAQSPYLPPLPGPTGMDTTKYPQERQKYMTPEIRKELQRATGEKRSEKVKARGRDKLWFVAHALILTGCAVVYWLLSVKLIPLPQTDINIADRLLRGTALIVIVLGIARGISVYALARIEDSSTRFTLQRVMHLVVALVIAVIVISIIFVNWYGAVAALGLLIGMALARRK